MEAHESVKLRRERRFSTCDAAQLNCQTFYEYDDPTSGTVVDISPHGLRLLCQGDYAVGQPIVIEIRRDELLGVYSGLVRRVQPWVEGKSVLGCQLLETIPDSVLEALAREQIINRRCDVRTAWRQPAKMSWELQPGEVDVEVRDWSLGGMKVFSQTEIPADVNVRIRVVPNAAESCVLTARVAWQNSHHDGYVVGLAFTKRGLPASLANEIAARQVGQQHKPAVKPRRWLRRGLVVAGAGIAVGLIAFEAVL